MKVTLVFILLFVINLNAEVMSQQTVTIQSEETTYGEVFTKIRKQTGMVVVFNNNMLDKDAKLSVDFKNMELKNVLDNILKGYNISYEIFDDFVILKPSNTIAQQQKTIKGVVTDKSGNRLPGVSVIVKGTSTGVATDIDGKFELKLDAKKGTVLVFSFIGMKTKEIAYNGQTNINVILDDDSEQLEEVVVSGYSKIAKDRATGSFVKVDSESLEKVVTQSVQEKLEGAAAGVLLETEMGDGGTKLKMQIRGRSTFSAGADPLIVVDGFPMEADLSDFNPDDIESMNILQDAASASIWGARAANGVIVITTKKGSKGKTQVDFSVNMSIEDKPDISRLHLANSSDAIDALKEYSANGLNFTLFGGFDPSMELDPVSNSLFHWVFMGMGEDKLDAQLAPYRKVDRFKQYSDLFLQKKSQQQYNISVRGGSENSKYYVSLSHVNNKEKTVGDENNRTTLLINNDFKVNERFSVSTSLNLAYKLAEYNGVGMDFLQGNGFGVSRYYNILDDNGDYLYLSNGAQYTDQERERLMALGYLDDRSNPLMDQRSHTNKRVGKTVRANVGFEYKILPYLTFESKLNAENQMESSEDLYSPESSLFRYYYNQTSYERELDDGSTAVDFYLPYGNMYKMHRDDFRSWSMRHQLNFNKEFNDHKLTALVGFEIKETLSTVDAYQRFGYDSQSLTWRDYNVYGVTTGTLPGLSGPLNISEYKGYYKNRYSSYYFNAAYTYKNKYNFTISTRFDDSNIFGAEKTVNPLWSIGGAWNISREDFFDVGYVDMLKLRLTYGQNGNIARNSSVYTLVKKRSEINIYTNQDRWNISTYANPTLTWETTKNLNFAVDFALLNNKLSGSLEMYSKKTTEVLANKPITNIYGVSELFVNYGEIQNKGITFQINGDFTIAKGLKYCPSFNINYNDNKVVKAISPYTDARSFLGATSPELPEEGYSMFTAWAYDYAGLDKDGNPQVRDSEGNIKGVNDPSISHKKDLIRVGVTSPKVYGGFTNDFSYKNFTLSTLITYKLGHVYKRPSFYTNDMIINRVLDDVAQRWQKEGDEEKTIIPRIPTNSMTMFGYGVYWNYADDRYENASHIRLKQISLKYNLPTNLVKKIGLGALSVNAQVRNLGILWKASSYDYDPDYVPFNTSLTQMEGEKQMAVRPDGAPKPIYTFGIKASF